MLAQVTGKLVFSASKGLHLSADPQCQATTSSRSPCSSATTLQLTVTPDTLEKDTFNYRLPGLP